MPYLIITSSTTVTSNNDNNCYDNNKKKATKTKRMQRSTKSFCEATKQNAKEIQDDH